MDISLSDVVGVKESGDMRVRSCLMLPNESRLETRCMVHYILGILKLNMRICYCNPSYSI